MSFDLFAANAGFENDMCHERDQAAAGQRAAATGEPIYCESSVECHGCPNQDACAPAGVRVLARLQTEPLR